MITGFLKLSAAISLLLLALCLVAGVSIWGSLKLGNAPAYKRMTIRPSNLPLLAERVASNDADSDNVRVVVGVAPMIRGLVLT